MKTILHSYRASLQAYLPYFILFLATILSLLVQS
jgi:hypothetical protein